MKANSSVHCKVGDCVNNKRLKIGLCDKHYNRWFKYRDVNYVHHIYHSHGLSYTPEYRIWHSMKQRCENKNSKAYKWYGGRGIKVCDAWSRSFKAFYDDMGSRPSDKPSLDRINNNGNYEKDNCRWTTQAEQILNTRFLSSRNTSGYRGVCPKRNRWAAYIKINNKNLYLGTFDTPEQAAKAYNDAALIHLGSRSRLNIINST